jgi:hypothetical protein
MLFCSKTDASYTLCASYSLCNGRNTSLVAKLGLADNFFLYFPLNPNWKWDIGRGSRALSDSGVKVAENLLPPKKIASKILIKIITTFLA